MELEQRLYNKSLIEIIKKGTEVRLIFSNLLGTITLKFSGYLFETPTSPINKNVISVTDSSIIGFKGITQLRYEKKDPSDYRQMTIKMQDPGGWKIELICIYSSIEFQYN